MKREGVLMKEPTLGEMVSEGELIACSAEDHSAMSPRVGCSLEYRWLLTPGAEVIMAG